MKKKKYIAPAIIVLDCEIQNCILVASDRIPGDSGEDDASHGIQWNPGVGGNIDIFEEGDDLNDEITG